MAPTRRQHGRPAGSRPELLSLLLGCAAAIEVAVGLPHLATTPARQVALVLVGYALATVALGWLLYRLSRPFQRRRRATGGELAVVLVAGLAFRLTLLPLAPATSGDVYRYLWEGIVQTRGYNPYALAPDDPRLAPLAQELPEVWPHINHRDLAAVYPPASQLLFRANALLTGGTLGGWKLILLAFDVLLAGAILWWLRCRGASTLLLAGVWWCPLLLFETYEAGHLDLIGVALMTLGVVAASRRRPLLAGVALGLAIDVKYFWPALVTVYLLARSRSWTRALALGFSAAITAGVCWWPYRDGLNAAVGTLRRFAESWTFNDLFFELLRQIPWDRRCPGAVVTLMCVALAIWLARRRRARELWRDVGLICGVALLLGPVAYPWYFLWMLPALAWRPQAWLLAWLALVPALHLVDLHYVATGRWDPMPWLWCLVDLLPAVLLLAALRRRLAGAGPHGY